MIFGQKYIPLFWTVIIFQRRLKFPFWFRRTQLVYPSLLLRPSCLVRGEHPSEPGGIHWLQLKLFATWAGAGGYPVSGCACRGCAGPGSPRKHCVAQARPHSQPLGGSVGFTLLTLGLRKPGSTHLGPQVWEAGTSPRFQHEHLGVGLPRARTQGHLCAASNC